MMLLIHISGRVVRSVLVLREVLEERMIWISVWEMMEVQFRTANVYIGYYVVKLIKEHVVIFNRNIYKCLFIYLIDSKRRLE